MNRRHFLSAVAAAIPAMALDPERLLWVPGQRSYFDIHRPSALGQISIRFVKSYDFGPTVRYDLLFGWAQVGGLKPSGEITVDGMWAPNPSWGLESV